MTWVSLFSRQVAHPPRSTATNPGWDTFPSQVSLSSPPTPFSLKKENRISSSFFMVYGTSRDILPSSIEIIIMITSENRYEHGVSNFYRHQNCSFPSIIENCYREAICDLFPKFLTLCCLKTETQFLWLLIKPSCYCLFSKGSDPTSQLMRFARETRGTSLHLDIISLGRGQGPRAEEAITKAYQQKGKWVFLQNCHHAASFMPQLQMIVRRWGKWGEGRMTKRVRGGEIKSCHFAICWWG